MENSFLNSLSEAMANVECFDLRVALILVHPSDLGGISSSPDYTARTPELRPEWYGKYVGDLFGAMVIETPSVDAGFPDVIPCAGGTRSIVLYAMRPVEHYVPPPGFLGRARNRLRRLFVPYVFPRA
jgi:hypothetical protein